MITFTSAPPSANRSGGRIAPAFVFFALIGFGLLAGCVSEPESHVVSAPPPPPPTTSNATTTTTTTQQSAPVVVRQASDDPNQRSQTIIVTQAPPTPQPEAVIARPSPNHIWIPGYWTWQNNRYEWMAGHWELPPAPGSVWVAPRWETENGGYRFYEGYWK
jgi:hypothetical protein